MIFTLERSISDQLVESILDCSEDWEIDGTYHTHKSGLKLYASANYDQLRLVYPASYKDIRFSSEEKKQLYKAVLSIRNEIKNTKELKAKEALVALMNKKEKPPRGWGVNYPKDHDLAGGDPINYFHKVAWFGLLLILAFIYMLVRIA